jgi:hypothetical protein
VFFCPSAIVKERAQCYADIEFDVDFSGPSDEIVADLASLYPFEVASQEAKALADFAQFVEKTYGKNNVIPCHRAFTLIHARKIK